MITKTGKVFYERWFAWFPTKIGDQWVFLKKYIVRYVEISQEIDVLEFFYQIF